MANTKAKTEEEARDVIVRDQIIQACEKIEESYINLADLLREAWEGAYFAKWGYDSFEEYVVDEVGLSYHKARYYVKIAAAVKKLNIPWADIHGIGWTKMRLIAPIMTEENVAQWLEKAQNLTYDKLGEEVTDFKEIEGLIRKKSEDKPIKITLKLNKDSAEIFLNAVKKAQTIIDTESTEMALEHILYEWFMDRDDTLESVPLDVVCAWVQRSYGVEVKPVGQADVSAVVEGEETDAGKD